MIVLKMIEFHVKKDGIKDDRVHIRDINLGSWKLEG